MNQRMNKEELLALIESLGIDKDEFWVLSSGALVIRGILPDAGDLDIAVTSKALETLKNKFHLIQKENGWYQVNEKVECVLEQKKRGENRRTRRNFITKFICVLSIFTTE